MRSIEARSTPPRNRAIAFTGALMFLVVSNAWSAGNANPGVFPPGSSPYGMTYPEWAGDWLQWILSIPADRNPFFDADGRYCHMGQSAPVFLLGKNTGGTTLRHCTVAVGQSILLMPGGVFCLLRLDAETEGEMRACVEDALTLITNVRAVIDGVAFQGLGKYLFLSDVVTFTLAKDNIFGLAAGDYQGIVGGYFLIHAPMPAGEHVVHLHDEFPAFDFVSDVAYAISVKGDIEPGAARTGPRRGNGQREIPTDKV